jgi:hypothetical protein
MMMPAQHTTSISPYLFCGIAHVHVLCRRAPLQEKTASLANSHVKWPAAGRTNNLGVVWRLGEGLLTLDVGLPAVWVLGRDDLPHIANAEDKVCLQR